MRVKTLIALTEELTEIFVRENESLAARRPSELIPFQHDKARLAAAYAQSIREIAADRNVVAGASDTLMEQLREITRTFEDRATEQRALLEGAQLGAEGVLKAVATEAAAISAAPGYESNTGGKRAQRAAAPVALNERA